MPDILAAVLESCDSTPDAPAMTLGRRTLTYGDVRARIHSIAAALTDRGLRPGDRMLFSVRPGLDGICLALGTIAAGGTIVFADPGAGEAMFRARAGLAAPTWVAAESLLYAASRGPLRRLARSRGLDLPDYSSIVPDARHVHAGPWLPGVPAGSTSLRRLSGARRVSTPLGTPDQPALVIFTSGTTAHPKAVVHSRASLGAGLADFAAHVGLRAGEVVLTDQLMVGIPALIAGAHWTLPPAGADPGARPARYSPLLDTADVLFAVPAALDALLAAGIRAPLRLVLIGGAPVLRPLLQRVREQLPGTAIRAIYGMTEILPVAIADGVEKLARPDDGDYVGELMPSVRARIDAGELVVSGDGLGGYLGEPPLVELRTGDLARLDGRRLVLGGRAKDMFIRGTTNVYPGLYEPVIAGIPGVREAALAGVPNEIGDDELVLAIVGDASRVAAALPGLIDAAVMPDRMVVLDALPKKGRSQKLDRAALRELL